MAQGPFPFNGTESRRIGAPGDSSGGQKVHGETTVIVQVAEAVLPI